MAKAQSVTTRETRSLGNDQKQGKEWPCELCQSVHLILGQWETTDVFKATNDINSFGFKKYYSGCKKGNKLEAEQEKMLGVPFRSYCNCHKEKQQLTSLGQWRLEWFVFF